MNQSNFEDVGDFRRRFDLPSTPETAPGFLDAETLNFRVGFILEELLEFHRAHAQRDLAGCADALVDLVYVVMGTAHDMGLPFDPVWAEVRAANLRKMRVTSADGSKRRHAQDVVKPEGWRSPDIQGVINRYQVRRSGAIRTGAERVEEE